MACPRFVGRGQARINYRHIIWSLVKKPGAFARYRHREALFPTVVFRQAWEEMQKENPGRRGDLSYLRVLHLAASTMESEVEAALSLLLESKERLSFEAVKGLVVASKAEEVQQAEPKVSLEDFNVLLPGMAKEALA